MNYIIHINTLKMNTNYKAAIAEYAKRLGAYCKIEYHLECNIPRVPSSAYKIQITTTPNTITSEAFSNIIHDLAVHGNSNLHFFVGYSEQISNDTLSLSSMNMGNCLATTVLYEQIYRCYRILNHQPYHK